jgi:transposase-like protein
VAVSDGYRESKAAWAEVLLDLKRRGLQAGPKLAIGDGALGFSGGVAGGIPADPRAALLGAQDGQRAGQDA